LTNGIKYIHQKILTKLKPIYLIYESIDMPNNKIFECFINENQEIIELKINSDLHHQRSKIVKTKEYKVEN
jgi:hypothetical protein